MNPTSFGGTLHLHSPLLILNYYYVFPLPRKKRYKPIDSISYKERYERDSIRRAEEKAQKEAHEEYIRKMARDIVNSGRSSSRGDNMRGWDPASEDDMEENGMDRYMENNDDEGWK